MGSRLRSVWNHQLLRPALPRMALGLCCCRLAQSSFARAARCVGKHYTNGEERMSKAHPIVDMRSRPAFLYPFFGAAPGTSSYDVVRLLNRRIGGVDVDHFARAKDTAGFLAEMDGAEIIVAIMVARSVPGVRVSNKALAAVAAVDKRRLIGVASVDLIELGRDAAIDEARHAVQELGMKGVNLGRWVLCDPHEGRRRALDAALRTLPGTWRAGIRYVRAHNSGPVLQRSFGGGPCSKTFPKLPIICCHGFYPYVNEMVTVAFRNENVYVSPDMYTFSPGGGLYVEAANGFMRDQFLFESSYPFRPMKQGVQDFRELGLSSEAYEAATFRTPHRLLDLQLHEDQEDGISVSLNAMAGAAFVR